MRVHYKNNNATDKDLWLFQQLYRTNKVNPKKSFGQKIYEPNDFYLQGRVGVTSNL